MWHAQEVKSFISLDNNRAMRSYIEVEVEKSLDEVWEGKSRGYLKVRCDCRS
jgi:hypothetical protein